MSLPPDSPLLPDSPAEPSAISPPPQDEPGLPLPSIPYDLDVPWNWRELLIFLLASLLIATAAGFPILLLFKIFGGNIHAILAAGSSKQKSLFLLCIQALWSVAVMFFLWARIRRHFQRPFWKTIGWQPVGLAPSLGLLSLGCSLAFLVQLAASKLPSAGKLPIQQFFQDRESALLLMLMSVLMAPLVEETIFRGYIYPVFARSWGIGSAILATGALFGLMHASQLWTGWSQIALLIFVGVVFTAVRAFTRSVTASWLVHLSYNGFLFLGFLASGGLRNLH